MIPKDRFKAGGFAKDAGIAPSGGSGIAGLKRKPNSGGVTAEEKQPKQKQPPAVMRKKGTPHANRQREAAGAEQTKASSCMLPNDLLEEFKQARDEMGVSNGDLIIQAIGKTIHELPSLLEPFSATVNEAGFVTTEGGGEDLAPAGPQALLAFRMSAQNFERLDQLVDELGAANRTQIIRTALVTLFNSDR